MGTYFSDWSMEDVERHRQRIKQKAISNIPQKGKSIVDKPRAKYGNQKVEYQGQKYDSKKELNRSMELEKLQNLGLIKDLQKQVPFELQPKFKFLGKTIRAINYVADFVYKENGELVVEDVKSPITRKNPVYKLKKKMMMYIHGIEIKEV